MSDLVRRTEVGRLLDALAPLEDRLLPNELEMVRSLRAKYADPGATDFDDAVVLEVILRNIEVRRRAGMDPRTDGGRVYELKRAPERPDDEESS